MKAFFAAALLLAASPAGAEPNAPPAAIARTPAVPDPMDALIRRAVARAHLQIKPPPTQQEIDAAQQQARQRAQQRAQERTKLPLSETPLPQ